MPTKGIGMELSKLFERDLNRLSKELNSYSNENDIWTIRGEISNSSGNLALHLCGNLNHFIGAILSKSGYERNRSLEFEGRVSLEDIQKEIEAVSKVVCRYLDEMDEDEMTKEFPLQPLGHPMTTSEFIFHLYGHFNYHFGQINYHRRLLNLE